MPSRLSVTVPDTTSRGSAMCLFSCRPSLARRPYAARSDAAGRRRSRTRRRNWRWTGTRLGAGDAITVARATGRDTCAKGERTRRFDARLDRLSAPSANGCLAAFRVASVSLGKSPRPRGAHFRGSTVLISRTDRRRGSRRKQIMPGSASGVAVLNRPKSAGIAMRQGGVPDLPSPRLRAAAAGRHSPLHRQDRLRKTPLPERGCDLVL